jgi:hypothetical protein
MPDLANGTTRSTICLRLTGVIAVSARSPPRTLDLVHLVCEHYMWTVYFYATAGTVSTHFA